MTPRGPVGRGASPTLIRSGGAIGSVGGRGATSVAATMMGRFGWGLADQLFASATNFFVGLIVARTVGPQDLGAFSLAYATFTFSLAAVRAIAGELLAVRHSAVSYDVWREGVKHAAGIALLAGVVVGSGCLIAGASVGEPFRTVLTIVGVSLPILLVQDVWRFAFFARGRGGAAFLNDVAWAVAMLVVFALLHRSEVSSVAWLTVGWAGAGCVAAFVGVFQLKLVPSGPLAAIRWLRQHRDIAPRFFAEFGVGSGISTFTLFAIGGIAGLGELGRLRAGEIALGPLNVLFAGVGLVAVPEGVRLLHESPRRLLHGCRWLSLIIAAGVLGWGIVLLLLPTGVGEAVLRTNWGAARSLLPPLVLALIGYGLSFGAWTGLRSLADAKRSLRARCIDGMCTLVFALGGAYLGGATGVAWGQAATGFLRSVNAWWHFSSSLREHERRRQTTDEAAASEARAAESPVVP